ncbi:hypothetical protein MTR_4g115150 [Medicago truncatula]|uniref:Uncharacterized protein n=1 Tax=Medicago truncatula TaxID=3880 RepID=G7JE81_MEDTR|nr:hypothetical protein MTR_4g115150 [Medicago truncatula]
MVSDAFESLQTLETMVAYILFDHDNLHKWLAEVVSQDPFDLVHPPATIAKDLPSVPRAFTGPASAHD